MKEKILIIDDEVNICTSLVLALKTKYEVMIVDNASDGLFCFQADHFSVCLMDLNVDSRNEMELIKEIKEIDDKVIIIIMTAYTSVSDSMEAIKNGAYTYLIKPLDIQELFLVIKRALKYRYLDERVEYLSQKLEEKNTYHGIIGKSPQMQDVFQMIEKVKNLTTSVLVTGKSGTGKELAARALHYSSGRKQYHFEDVNCAAIPESLLEEELFGHKKVLLLAL